MEDDMYIDVNLCENEVIYCRGRELGFIMFFNIELLLFFCV